MNPRFAMTACVLMVENDTPPLQKEVADQIRREFADLWAMQPAERKERIDQILRKNKE